MSGPAIAVFRAQIPKLADASRGEHVSVTWSSIEATCPTSCKLHPVNRTAAGVGCYGKHGPAAWVVGRLDRAAQGLTPEQVAAIEAAAVDGLRAVGQPLRLGLTGDAVTPLAARTRAAAGERFMLRGGGPVWGYSHAWRDVPRNAWGRVSILASVHSAAEGELALSRGYAPARTVRAGTFPARAFRDRPVGGVEVAAPPENVAPRGTGEAPAGGIRWIPCPEQIPGSTATCASCRLCMHSDRLVRQRAGILFDPHGGGARRVSEVSE